MIVLFLVTFVVVLATVAAMAVGVILAGKRLRGSCGGVGGDDCWCEKRSLDPAACERHQHA